MARAVASGTRADVALLAISGLLSFAALALPANLRDPLAAGLRRTFIAPLIALQRDAELGGRRSFATTPRLRSRTASSCGLFWFRARSGKRPASPAVGAGSRPGMGVRPCRSAPQPVPGGGVYAITLHRGADAGVRQFSPVVAPEGLVGMVETVDPTMSLAIIWAHPDFRVSAMAADGSAFGIVKPHLSSSPERYLLELSGVQLSASLPTGTPIVSSGVGGVYPRGIPVGTVIGELKTTEGWARTYLVQPAVHPFDVTSVLILQPKRVVAGVQSVWAGADSGRRLAGTLPIDSALRDAHGTPIVPRDTVLDVPDDPTDTAGGNPPQDRVQR